MLSPETIKQAVLELKEPVIFQGFQEHVGGENNPEFLRWELDKFVEVLGDTMLSFRTGDNARTAEPQWDIKSPIESMRLSTFIRKTEFMDPSKWYYFDYKYMHQWFGNRPEILESIDWKRFGFDKDGNDSTLWIGSKGAHTNCHQDSYGCNLVAQIHGRKQWLLFPPDAGNTIKPTRIPYEESTVYSKFNFFCPTKDDEEAIMRMKQRPKLVELEPGQVLLVPHGWWHYVESLDTSISINIWLPVDADYKGRLKEALVKLLVTKIGEGVPCALEEESRYTRREFIKLVRVSDSMLQVVPSLSNCNKYGKAAESSQISRCINDCNENTETSAMLSPEKRVKRAEWTAKDLANEYPTSVKLLPDMSSQELSQLLTNKRERFPDIELPLSQCIDEKRDPEFQQSLESVVDALCHFDVIDKVADFLLHSER